MIRWFVCTPTHLDSSTANWLIHFKWTISWLNWTTELEMMYWTMKRWYFRHLVFVKQIATYNVPRRSKRFDFSIIKIELFHWHLQATQEHKCVLLLTELTDCRSSIKETSPIPNSANKSWEVFRCDSFIKNGLMCTTAAEFIDQ